MTPWMLALIAGRSRILRIAGPFTANTTFVVPMSTSKIETISGRGGTGTPASSGTIDYREDKTLRRYDFASKPSTAVVVSSSRTVYTGGSLPGDYCNPAVSGGDSLHPDATQRQTCYTFDVVSESYNSSATTGASTTAFGKVFPGGVGGPAATVTFTNIDTTPGEANNFGIPSGGSITFTYYE